MAVDNNSHLHKVWIIIVTGINQVFMSCFLFNIIIMVVVMDNKMETNCLMVIMY